MDDNTDTETIYEDNRNTDNEPDKFGVSDTDNGDRDTEYGDRDTEYGGDTGYDTMDLESIIDEKTTTKPYDELKNSKFNKIQKNLLMNG